MDRASGYDGALTVITKVHWLQFGKYLNVLMISVSLPKKIPDNNTFFKISNRGGEKTNFYIL